MNLLVTAIYAFSTNRRTRGSSWSFPGLYSIVLLLTILMLLQSQIGQSEAHRTSPTQAGKQNSPPDTLKTPIEELLESDEDFEDQEEEEEGEEDEDEDGDEEDEERGENKGWTVEERELCQTMTNPSPEPCFLIWLNPVTFIRTEILHRRPTVMYFHRMFPQRLASALTTYVNQTDEMIEMHPFSIETGEEDTDSDTRIMDAAYLDEEQEPLVQQIFKIVRQLVGLNSIAFDNSVEVFRYRPGGHFSRHFDTHSDEDYWGEKWLSTMLLYFRIPEHCNCGTAFPDIGLNANPKSVGDAIYFYNILTDGEMDPLMEHSGCPVSQGEKWSAWIGFNADDDQIGATCSKKSTKYMDFWHQVPEISEKRRRMFYQDDS